MTTCLEMRRVDGDDAESDGGEVDSDGRDPD